MFPITLITGFLGSGKTTLLRRIIERHRSQRLVYLVNEFGAVDIDGQLLELEPGQLVSIPGGSIFCRCLTGEFIRVLSNLSNSKTSSEVYPRLLPQDNVSPQPQGVVIEASGIANPKVIGQMLAETKLDKLYELRQIITVIDPGSFYKLVNTLPNIVAQVEAADLAIINKADLYEAEQLDAAEQAVREINPASRVVRARHCEVELDVVSNEEGGAEPRRSLAEKYTKLVGEYAPCADPHYITRTVEISASVDMDMLMDALRTLQPKVYRIKGFVPTPGGSMYVDVSASGVSCRQADNENVRYDLVFIAEPVSWPCIEDVIRHLQPGSSLRIL